jgi:hypothetical protein
MPGTIDAAPAFAAIDQRALPLGLKVCAFEGRPDLPSGVTLTKCPLGLVAEEHAFCACRRRERVTKGDTLARVVTCRYPKDWQGRQIIDPVAFAEGQRLKARQKLETLRAKAAIDQAEKFNPGQAANNAKETESMTTVAEPVPATMTASPPAPLWPQPIPIIGATGEHASGKTLFSLTIAPGPATRSYDWEKSNETYPGLKFDRIDVPAELLKIHRNGYKPIDAFTWWWNHIKQIPTGKFRVIALDPASDIESGATDWVRANPAYFSRTPAQYQKIPALMLGDMKELWKIILADLASRCETFVFTVHMGDIWSDNKPTGKRKPKGKSTLMELASLFLKMERKPDAQGNYPEKPSATVLKSRLTHMTIYDDPSIEPVIVPALPPRLPVATPAAIRKYLLAPPDYKHLQHDELAPEETLSDDDRAAMTLQTAEAQRDAEQLRLERFTREQEAVARKTARAAAPVSLAGAPAAIAERMGGTLPQADAGNAKNFTSHATAPDPATTRGPGFANDAQLTALLSLRDMLFAADPSMTQDQRRTTWKAILAKPPRNVTTALDLTEAQAEELIVKLRYQLQVQQLQEGLADASPKS